jgi:ATP-dependent RNA helicase DeaD
LAIQVKTEINSLKIKKEDDFDVVAVYGGADIHEQIRKIREGCDIIVATPGRLIDLLERGAIKLSHLLVTCLDEADEMLKQGFQEDI